MLRHVLPPSNSCPPHQVLRRRLARPGGALQCPVRGRPFSVRSRIDPASPVGRISAAPRRSSDRAPARQFRPNASPEVRFPSALGVTPRCPVVPPSGRSRFDLGHSRCDRCVGVWSLRACAPSLRFYAERRFRQHCASTDTSRPRAMHRRFGPCDVERPVRGNRVACPAEEVSVGGAPGVHPSQVWSCPRFAGRLRPPIPPVVGPLVRLAAIVTRGRPSILRNTHLS